MKINTRSIALPTLVGRIKLSNRNVFEDELGKPLDQTLRGKEWMRILLLVVLRLSEGPLVLDKIALADFGIPSARLICESGYVGIAFLQDEVAASAREAIVHVSGRAGSEEEKIELAQIQCAVADRIESMSSELNLHAIAWSK